MTTNVTTIDSMRSVPVREAKAQLSALIDETATTHEIVQITKHGKPAVVMMAAEDLESLHETIFWLSQPGIREDIAEAKRDIATGSTTGLDELRAEYGLPPVADG